MIEKDTAVPQGNDGIFNFFKKSATKRLLAYRYGARKGNLTFFQNYSLNRGFHSLYGVKEENIFILNLTFGSCRSLYGAKKIFHSIVGNNGVAWVVRYEKKFFHQQLSRMTLSFPIWYRKRKSFEYWLRFCSFPTRYIGKTIFFFCVL